jgi:hypothetical protein
MEKTRPETNSPFSILHSPFPEGAPSVDAGRIQEWLRAFARIGYSADGGMRRLAFSRGEFRARQLLIHLLERTGLRSRVDGIGNCFGRLPGAREPDAPPVLLGSHLDTVPGGGRFDGAVGVVAALVITRFQLAGIQPVLVPSSIALAFGVSAGVGIIFGVVPAQRAGKLDPVIALRTE